MITVEQAPSQGAPSGLAGKTEQAQRAGVRSNIVQTYAPPKNTTDVTTVP